MDDAGKHNLLDQIMHASQRAANLTRQLLAFSRKQILQPKRLNLSEVAQRMKKMLGRLIGERYEIHMSCPAELPPILADEGGMEQILINLVVNSRDAMASGGVIQIETGQAAFDQAALAAKPNARLGKFVCLTVSDRGCGMNPEVLAHIFEPFYTTKDVGKGTGLGLSMVYGIIKQTGGYVFCDSEPGQGATFRILLPRRQGDEADEPVKQEAVKPAADLTGRGAILLVEDEEAVRAFASRALASRGYTVLEAETGLDALRVAEKAAEPIDLIVSDVIMPEMDGPTMLTELRRRGLTAKVIFVSGYADDAFARNLPEGQEFVFLPKPFSLKQLIETVKGLMN
jgi:two-component system, cell cycle sensor histidine kinase and response regulator CckA